MFGVVIIDDEPMICRGLAQKINWNKWNCEVLGTGTNGLEGKELIERVRPHIVITDIKMPGMTGLELAHYIRSQFPDTITIFLTGYNEFEFARTAIRENVFDYLIKPIDTNELHKTMEKATNQLRLQKQSVEENEHIKNQLIECFSLAETGLILELMLNSPNKSDDLQEKVSMLKLNIKMGRVILYEWSDLLVELLDTSQLHDLIIQRFKMKKFDTIPLVVEGRSVVVVKYNSGIPRNINEDRIMEAVQDLHLLIEINYNIKVFAGIGDYFHSLENLHASYDSAFQNLKFRMFWYVDDYNFIEKHAFLYNLPSQKEISKLCELVEQGDLDTAIQMLHQIFEALKKEKNLDLTRNLSLEIMFNLTKIAKNNESELEDNLIIKIMESSHLNEIIFGLERNIQSICRVINENKRVGRENIIYMITLFLQNNFHVPEISLRLVADQFHLSESHFSRLFKKRVGINFIDYLTQLRLEKAKSLLHEMHWLSNDEIARQVGFNDGNYMGQVFKKNYGMTIWEYKGRRAKKS